LALKQDLLSQTLALGALSIDGDPAVAVLKHDEGVALQTSDGSLTYGVFSPSGATFRQLVVQEALVVPDSSLALSKISGLAEALNGKSSVEAVEALTRKYDSKEDKNFEIVTLADGLFQISGENGSFQIRRFIDGAYSPLIAIQTNAGESRVSVFGELRPSSIVGLQNLDVVDTLSCTRLLATNIYQKTQVDELLSTFSYRLPDNSLQISKIDDLQRQLDTINEIRRAIQVQLAGAAEYGVYTRDDLDALTAVVSGKQGTLDTSSSIDVASVVCGTLAAGATVINSGDDDIPFICGSSQSFLRVKNGHHVDAYNRDGSGRWNRS
jgi:hypothetical protein